MERHIRNQYALALAISVALVAYSVALFALFVIWPPAVTLPAAVMVLVLVWADRT